MTRDLFEEAKVLETAERLPEAIERLREAAAVAPGPKPLTQLGRLYVRAGRGSEGEAVLRDVILRYPDYSPAYFHLARLLEGPGNAQEEVRALYETSVQLQPWAPALVRLGKTYLTLNMKDEARQSFERAIALNPNESDAWFGLGYIVEHEDRDAAIEYFEKAIEADAEHGPAHRELGRMLTLRGDDASAEEHIRIAIRVNGGDAWAHDYLGAILDRADRLDESETHYRIAIDLWPTLPLFHCHLGNTLGRLGREEAAESALKIALSLDESYYLANLEMGWLLEFQGKIPQARVYLECALQSNPSDHRVQEALARLPPEAPDDPPTSH